MDMRVLHKPQSKFFVPRGKAPRFVDPHDAWSALLTFGKPIWPESFPEKPLMKNAQRFRGSGRVEHKQEERKTVKKRKEGRKKQGS